MNRAKLRAIRIKESIQDSRDIVRNIQGRDITPRRKAKQDKTLRKFIVNTQFIQSSERIPIAGDGMRIGWAMKPRKGWIRADKLAVRPV